jgi:hypothetical protein
MTVNLDSEPCTIAQDRYAAALGGLKSIISMTFSK